MKVVMLVYILALIIAGCIALSAGLEVMLRRQIIIENLGIDI